MKKLLCALAVLVGLQAVAAHADCLGKAIVGFDPVTGPIFGPLCSYSLISSVTGNVTQESFLLNVLPSTTPGMVSRFGELTATSTPGDHLLNLQTPYVTGDSNEYVEFTGGVLDSISYFYQYGARSIGFTTFSENGLAWSYDFFPPVGPTGPIGSGQSDYGVISFSPVEAATPEP